MATYSQRIQDTNQDGSKYIPDSSWATYMSRLGDAVITGLRFTNVTIPSGSTIDSAYLKGCPLDGDFGETHVKIAGIDEDSTATMSSDPTGRTKTTAQVDWDILTDLVEDQEYVSPDIKTIVQEIIDRDGWSSGNAIGFLITNDGGGGPYFFHDYEDTSSLAFLLEINYSLPTTTSSSTSTTTSTSSSTSSTTTSGATTTRTTLTSSSTTSSTTSTSTSTSTSTTSSSSTSSSSTTTSPPPPMHSFRDYGMKISKEGVNVLSADEVEDYILTTSKGIIGKRAVVTITATTDASGVGITEYVHGLEYAPFIIATVQNYDNIRVVVPNTWYYYRTSGDEWEGTEIFSYQIDATKIYVKVDLSEFNITDQETTQTPSGRVYNFKVIMLSNEISDEV